jgi:S1/P1 Nuclease
MIVRRMPLVLAVLIFLCAPAFAWGPEGHQVIGSIADQLLTDQAKQQVAKILGFELRVASTWPDCARSVVRNTDGSFEYVVNPRFEAPCTPFASTAERGRIMDYVSRNWSNCTYEDKPTNCHKAFHFADVAIQHDNYDRKYVGTSDHDVVSAINAAILVLQDKPAPFPFSIKDKKEALFMLAHFVGDLHQPLHVGAIYLDAAGRPVNPDDGTFDKNSATAGGNFISESHGNLHAEWDAIPKKFGTSSDQTMVTKAREVPRTVGSLDDWAATWASDTVVAAHSAFSGLSFTGAGAHKWAVQFDDHKAYVRAENQLKEKQLAKGGARLAELLNAIWP